MNKRAARKLAESETLSIGDLRKMIAARRNVVGISRVNPLLTIEEAADIFEGSIAGREDTEVPKAWKPDPYSKTYALKHTRDVLLITNILWECA